MLAEIQSAYMAAKTYPELVRELLKLGVQSYTVEVSTEITLYRFKDGFTVTRQPGSPPTSIAMKIDQELVKSAILENQQGKTNYAGFILAIGAAGVRFYEATLEGTEPRVNYIGIGGEHIEPIRLS